MFLRDKIIFSTSYSTFRTLSILILRIPDFQAVFKQLGPYVIFVHGFFLFWRHKKTGPAGPPAQIVLFVREIAGNVLAPSAGGLYNENIPITGQFTRE